jgi:membrane protease YdiL (CAAX protease family)
MSNLGAALKSNRSFWTNPVVVVICAVLLYFMSQIIGAILALPFLGFISKKNAQLCVLIVASFIALYGLISTAMKALNFSWSEIGVKLTKPLIILAIIPVFILYALASTYLTNLAIKYLPGFDVDQVQNIGMVKTGSANIILAFISLVIITPLYEELIFRGVLFSGLRKRLPFIVSAILASVVFGIAHMQLNLAIDTFALSMFLCLFVEKTKSIVPGIVLHALKNFIAFGVLFLGWSVK